MRNKKKIIGVVTVILLLIVGWVIWGNKALMINEITIKDEKIPDSFSGFRIAQIICLEIQKR